MPELRPGPHGYQARKHILFPRHRLFQAGRLRRGPAGGQQRPCRGGQDRGFLCLYDAGGQGSQGRRFQRRCVFPGPGHVSAAQRRSAALFPQGRPPHRPGLRADQRAPVERRGDSPPEERPQGLHGLHHRLPGPQSGQAVSQCFPGAGNAAHALVQQFLVGQLVLGEVDRHGHCDVFDRGRPGDLWHHERRQGRCRAADRGGAYGRPRRGNRRGDYGRPRRGNRRGDYGCSRRGSRAGDHGRSRRGSRAGDHGRSRQG